MTTQNSDNETAQNDGRDTAFYAAMVGAWVNTKMERDKQVLTLASLGLGGLVAFTSTLDTNVDFYFWLGAAISFLLSIMFALIIFRLNASYVEKLIKSEAAQGEEALLDVLDWIVMGTFFIGVCLTFGLAIAKTDYSMVKNAKNKGVVENVRQISQ